MKFLLMILSVFTLSACVSREQADDKLARGCAAGAELFMTESYKIKEIKSQKFEPSAEFGSDYREVILSVVESDGWSNIDKDIACVFDESFGFLGAGYTAHIHQLKMNDQVYGRQGNEILGTMEDHLKLMETVDEALGQ